MIDLIKSVKQIEQASVAERIQVIELILESLKRDMKIKFIDQKFQAKYFRVRQFNLGKEVEIDRE